MGRERTVQDTRTTQTQKATPTAEETELNKLALERQRAIQDQQIETQQSAFNLFNQLLSGNLDPEGSFGEGGVFSSLTRGFSPEAIGNESARLAGRNLTNFQSLGIADSGTAFKQTAEDIANSILLPSEQSRTANLFNLLNLGAGGQASAQSGALSSSQGAGARLAGLRTINTTGNTNQLLQARNPFLKSFEQGFGGSLGKGLGTGTSGLFFTP